MNVYTGDNANGGTRAKVYMAIDGTKGSTGRRFLAKSLNNDLPFQQGQVDEFMLEAVDLGTLQKVTLGHDGRQPGKVGLVT